MGRMLHGLLVWMAIFVTPLTGRIIVQELSPISGIKNCMPLTVSIEPTRPSDRFKYSLRVEGEDNLLEALGYDIINEVLIFTLTGDLNLNYTAKIYVTLPKGELIFVEGHHALGQINVAEGFDVGEFAVRSLGSRVLVNKIFADKIAAIASGTGVLVVNGLIQEALIAAKSSARLVINKVHQKAHVEAANVAKVYLIGTDNLYVEGHIYMIGAVYVDKYQECKLTKTLAGFQKPQECKPLNLAEVPSVEVYWTSQLQSTGRTSCGFFSNDKKIWDYSSFSFGDMAST